jgi:uncharacterized protein (UPF0276 family)
MRQLSAVDRVGLGWRGALAASIFAHLDAVDVVEVIAEDHLNSSRRVLRSLRSLGREVPIVCHGVSLGLASVAPVEAKRIQRLARLLEAVDPETWSEHLAFVRGGAYEIGHLAAPPRNPSTVEGAVINLERIRAMVGQAPAVENIATLVDPPDSSMDEPEWVTAIADASSCALLLDLHNLYANCVNFGRDPVECLRQFPLQHVRLVHLSGGEWVDCDSAEHGISTRRLLDDHVHDVPGPVFGMLACLAEQCPDPLTVIIERDGRFPEFRVLLEQIACARQALADGRRRRQVVQERTIRELAAV